MIDDCTVIVVVILLHAEKPPNKGHFRGVDIPL